MDRVLSVAEASDLGLSWWRLQRSDWRRVGPGQYARPPLADAVRVEAAAARLPAGAAFAGRTAAWLHGLEERPGDRIEVVAPPSCRVSSRSKLWLRRASLEADELVFVNGVPVTSPARTIADL